MSHQLKLSIISQVCDVLWLPV